MVCLFFPSCAKSPFICKLLGGSCFVWRVTTSLRINNTEKSSAIQTKSHLYWSSLISNSEYFMVVFFWTLPRCVPEHPLKFSPLSAPHQTKEKRTAPLALSPRCHSFPMSLALLSPALCSSLSADAPTAAATFDGKQMSKIRHRCAGEDGRPLTWGLGAPGATPCVAEKVWKGTSSFLLWSPPLSTRVIDGWGSFWPRLVHFALQRVPPSPSQTMHTRVGLITNKHVCTCIK